MKLGNDPFHIGTQWPMGFTDRRGNFCDIFRPVTGQQGARRFLEQADCNKGALKCALPTCVVPSDGSSCRTWRVAWCASVEHVLLSGCYLYQKDPKGASYPPFTQNRDSASGNPKHHDMCCAWLSPWGLLGGGPFVPLDRLGVKDPRLLAPRQIPRGSHVPTWGEGGASPIELEIR